MTYRFVSVLLVSLAMCRIIAAAEPSRDRSVIEFRPIVMEEPATMMSLTEDGRFLVVTHQAANRISIVDAATGELATALDTPSPRAVICRGDGIYVANHGQGTISFFSSKENWDLVNEFEIDMPNIVHLSAAQGSNFDGRLLVTCHAPGVEGSYHGPVTFLLDTRRDRATKIAQKPLASMSYDGKLVLAQQSFNLSPSGGIEVFAAADFIKPGAQPLFRGGIMQTPYVYQTHPGSYWIGPNIVFAGSPIQPLRENIPDLLIPDLSTRAVYALTNARLTAHRLDSALTELGSRKVSFPSETAQKFDSVTQTIYRRRQYLLDHPIGWTEGNQLRLFVIDMNRNAILTATTEPFLERRTAPIRPEQNTVVEMPDEDEAKPAAKAPEQLGIPSRLAEGSPLNLRLVGPPGAEYDLIAGPPGMTLSSANVLNWPATSGKIGVHRLKIRVKTDTSITFARPMIEVISKDLIGPDQDVAADGTDAFTRLDVDPDHLQLTPSLNYDNLLLLQGDRLRVLGPDGFSVTSETQLPERYRFIAERKSHFVAVSTQPPQLDLIDKRTGKSRKSIALDRAGVRILDVMDIAIHPQRETTFITIKHDVDLPRYRILVVDENRGVVTAPNGLIGTWVEVDPTGRYLYAGYKDIYEQGSHFHINPDWRLIETPDYGNVDWLISYELRGRLIKPREIELEAGGNGNGIRLSPDGRRISYLSIVGTPLHSKNLAGWNPTNLERPPVTYHTKDRAVTTLLAFHPSLPIVAVPGSGSAVLFDRESGKLLSNRLQLTSTGLGDAKVDELIFSPDGTGLIFLCNDPTGGRYLRRVGLRLSESELKIASKGASTRPIISTTVKPAVDFNEFDALKQTSQSAELTVKEIARQNLDAVVTVQSDKGSGTGFVVGRHGYILTCAHVLPFDGQVTVTVIPSAGSGAKAKTLEAEVIRQDDDRDLALLKIASQSDLVPVTIAAETSVEAGESVTVIGNPGAGESVLTQTVTTGIVSSPAREIEDQTYIQTSAAINPGNSGGPMFDSHGRVIGLVVLKASIEGVAFAVPATELRTFLIGATQQKK